MFGKFSKTLLVIAFGLTAISTLQAVETISYHSLLEIQKQFSASPVSPKCDPETEERLRAEFTQNTRDIFKKEKTPESLIKDCKKVFYNISDDFLPMYETSEENDSEEGIQKVINISDGLPEAALRLQTLYETNGDYNKSLFWGLVSCKLGYGRAAVDSFSRVLLLQGTIN